MKQNTHVKVSQLFAEAQPYIDNASAHPEIRKKINQHGFTPNACWKVPHGLSPEEINQSVATVEAISAIRNQRIMSKGDAEEATRLRDQSLKALRAWMRDFRAISKVALRDSPQLLESLGIVVKTQKV